MLVWVVYPPEFDPGRKYPALLYCEGGPQSVVSQFFSFRWNLQIMAANDYIVVAPNRRGLPTFGEAWNRQISGDYGGQNIRDYFSAIDALSKEPYVDKDHLGAVGASYGGFSVYYLAGHHKGRFKSFISHCGIYNLVSMYGATEETFFVNFDLEGPYWKKPTPHSYQFSPHLFVDKWDTPIMIITGGNDLRVPYTQSLEAYNAALLRGIPAKLLYFPNETHFGRENSSPGSTGGLKPDEAGMLRNSRMTELPDNKEKYELWLRIKNYFLFRCSIFDIPTSRINIFSRWPIANYGIIRPLYGLTSLYHPIVTISVFLTGCV